MTLLIKRWSLLLLIIPVLLGSSCSSDSNENSDVVGNWVSRFSFNGEARSEAVSFTIGNKVYIGTGINDEEDRLTDFWEYDAPSNLWRRVRPFPGAARSGAVAFSISGKGYVGTGYDDDGNRLKDFYEFTPPTSTSDSGAWVKINDFAGSARMDATAFSIGNKGYIVSGYDGSFLKDFWEFSPGGGAGGKGEWVERSFPGNKRRDGVVFLVNNKAYFGTGLNNGIVMTDFWEFDPASGWARKRDISNASDESYDDDYTSIVRSNTSAFTIGSQGYLITGESGTGQDCWSYDPGADLWTKKTAFEGAPRTGALGFTVENRGFVMTGRNGSLPNDDLWEFFPDVEQVDND
ncbi:MAG: galactose oxidase [Chitinophagaceae bacterium]|nr:galactose oxidase [Chitinophagaceae bacterium]